MGRASHYVWRLVATLLLLIVYFSITNPMFCALEGKGWNSDCTPIRVDAFVVIPIAVWFAVTRARRGYERQRARFDEED